MEQKRTKKTENKFLNFVVQKIMRHFPSLIGIKPTGTRLRVISLILYDSDAYCSLQLIFLQQTYGYWLTALFVFAMRHAL